MLETAIAYLNDLLDIGEETRGIIAMTLRAFLVYIAALAMVRWGEKRFLGKNTAFDIILGIILGSVVSRAITNPEFIAILAAGFVLVGMHHAMATLAFRTGRLGPLVKGSDRILVKNGAIDWEQMKKCDMTESDLLSALRTRAGIADWRDVGEARLERSGDISVIMQERKPQVVSAKMEGDSLTIRIKLE